MEDVRRQQDSQQILKWVTENDVASVRTVIRGGVDISECKNFSGSTLLHFAVPVSLEMVKLLVEEGRIPVNTRNSFSHTALMSAIAFRDIDVVRYLLGAGADITTRNLNGEDSLDIACRQDPANGEIIDLLRAAKKTRPLLHQCTTFICEHPDFFLRKHLVLLTEDCKDLLKAYLSHKYRIPIATINQIGAIASALQ